jgi:flagellar hook protein FlgE
MDVIGANISNVNTVGYKASRVEFKSLLSQTIRGANAPSETTGGLNPIQVGLGMSLAGIDTLFTQGSPQDTGKLTDLAIQGSGFFVVDNGAGGYYYTRDGNLDVGEDGTLISLATGMKVLGWRADASGTVDSAGELETIEIPFGQNQARATSEAVLRGNLDSETDPADPGPHVESAIAVYDSLGGYHSITLEFTKTATNSWTWSASTTDTAVTIGALTDTTMTFTTDGAYDPGDPPLAPSMALTFSNGAEPATVGLDFETITQLDGLSNINLSSQDGLPPGSLTTFSVSTVGEVIGMFSNGINRVLGQLSLASFINPPGLMKMGQNLFAPSPNSGTAQVGLPNTSGLGSISAGYLEMSNVELAQQFTNMIVAQRGFQANSRVITASDEMLQELVNLKR